MSKSNVSLALVVLAAGKGTRIKMDLPKPLAPLHNNTLVDYVIAEARELGDMFIITGHKKEMVEEHIMNKHEGFSSKNFICQEEQLGTGHAVQTYFKGNLDADNYEYTMIMCADTPLLTCEVLEDMLAEAANGYDAVVATFNEENPYGYGRIIRADKGFSIVEEKDASDKQRKITEVNSGLYIFKTSYLKEHISGLSNSNNSGEFYLTDTVKEGFNVSPKLFADKNFFMGVNDLMQLSVVERKLKNRNQNYLLKDVGVRFLDPSHSYVFTKNVGKGTIIHPNVQIDDLSIIGENVIIEMGSIINNSKIENGAHIKANTYITDSVVGPKAKVGPMAQLRPGSVVGDGSKIGNFVEMKKSTLGKNTNVSHLSYVGDAEVGNEVNIGCGFITCNYDGANKHKTIIGDGSFIGSDSQMIAPINIGKECYVASGSTVNSDMPDGSFAIARAKQVTKEDMAKRFIKKK